MDIINQMSVLSSLCSAEFQSSLSQVAQREERGKRKGSCTVCISNVCISNLKILSSVICRWLAEF